MCWDLLTRWQGHLLCDVFIGMKFLVFMKGQHMPQVAFDCYVEEQLLGLLGVGSYPWAGLSCSFLASFPFTATLLWTCVPCGFIFLDIHWATKSLQLCRLGIRGMRSSISFLTCLEVDRPKDISIYKHQQCPQILLCAV